jgi:tRNA threonylcarbamoyladenosine biosynthesis protein TsaB
MKLFVTFDTSTFQTIAGIGFLEGDNKLLYSESLTSKSHGPVLLPLIDEALKNLGYSTRDMGAVGVNVGPGSFTGVRIGMATAKMFAYGLKIPLITTTSFEALLNQAENQTEIICTIIDARRGELYCSVFEKGIEILKPCLITPENLIELLKNYPEFSVIGTGAIFYKDFFISNGVAERNILENNLNPDYLFKTLLQKYKNSEFSDISGSEPLYIRKSDAEINLNKM